MNYKIFALISAIIYVTITTVLFTFYSISKLDGRLFSSIQNILFSLLMIILIVTMFLKNSEAQKKHLMRHEYKDEDQNGQQNRLKRVMTSQERILVITFCTVHAAVWFLYFIGRLETNHFWLIQF
jgi:uncharacterized membrane protein